VAEWKARDPIAALAAALEATVSRAELDAIAEQQRARIAAARVAARSGVVARADRVLNDVYAS
jgi:TPP-dependent pyruvate/acetoin dehydrogenase alpha subunit